jgi:adenine-specific DNA methylase
MAKCPQCGMEVSTPKKTWKMAGRPDKKGKRTELTIGLYECCGKSFRKVLNTRKI